MAGASSGNPLRGSVPAIEVQVNPARRLSALVTFLSRLAQTARDLGVAMPDLWQGHHGGVAGIEASLRGWKDVGVVPAGMNCGTGSRRPTALRPGASWDAGAKTAHDCFPAGRHIPSIAPHPVIKPCARHAHGGLNKSGFPSHNANLSSICQICFPILGQLALGSDTLPGSKRPERDEKECLLA